MKNNNYLKRFSILLIMLGFFIISSCSEEWLDEPKNTSGLPTDVIYNDPGNVEAFINGIMYNVNGIHYTVDSAGLNSIYFARTMRGNDLINSTSWYASDYEWSNRLSNTTRSWFTWNFSYYMINQANALIQGVEDSELADIYKTEYIAIGKTLRAFFYFQLILDYCPNYTTNTSISRLPIYLEPATGASVGNATSPASDVMELVITDLKGAIEVLSEDRLGKSYINKAVAQGFLARVLLVTQDDWGLTSSLAKEVYGGNAAAAVVSTSYADGFQFQTDPEWIWSNYQDVNEQTTWWSAPANLMDHISDISYYKSVYINANFVNTFSATDKRNQFQDFYGSTTAWREFISTKFTYTQEEDMSLMRNSEMVLIDAEAQYHLGNENGTGGAAELLFALQSDRDSNAVMSGNTGQDLLDEILLERRKELYGEIGVEWFDAKRYNLPITRDPDHRVVVDVPASSNLWYLQIPQSEIDANDNIDASINQD